MTRIIFLLCLSLWAGNYGKLEQRAQKYYEKNSFKKAILLYKKTAKLGAPAHLVAFNIGNCYYRSNEWALAAAAYKKSIRIEPFAFEAVHFNLAAVLYRLKEYGQSIATYHRALSIDPTNLAGWLFLGEVYTRSGDFLGAQRALEKAQELAPDDVSISYQLAEIMVNQKNYDSAIALIRRSYKINPQELDFLFYIGDLYRLQEDWDMAASAYREGLLLKPDDYKNHYKLADVLSLGEKDFLAMQALEKAILLKPDFNDAMVFLGNIAFDLNWWQKSSDHYMDALRLNNLEGLQGLRNIAYELEAKGDKTSGLAYLLKAQSIKPKDKSLAEEILTWQEN